MFDILNFLSILSDGVSAEDEFIARIEQDEPVEVSTRRVLVTTHIKVGPVTITKTESVISNIQNHQVRRITITTGGK